MYGVCALSGGVSGALGLHRADGGEGRREDLSDGFGSGDQTGFSKDSAPCKAWPMFCTSSSSKCLSDTMTHLSSQDQPDWHSKATRSWRVDRMEAGIGLGWRRWQALAPHALPTPQRWLPSRVTAPF